MNKSVAKKKMDQPQTVWDDGLASWEPKMDFGIDFKNFSLTFYIAGPHV